MKRGAETRRFDSQRCSATAFRVKSTVSISEGQAAFPALIKAAEKGSVVTVTRHDEPVACVISHARMSAIAETLELLGNAEFTKALAAHRAGKTKFGRLEDIPE